MLNGIEAVFFYPRLHRGRGGLHGHLRAQSRAFGPLSDPDLRQRGGLFLLTGAEFLAMILLVVYVGAVAVLFLFVVMMLDVGFAEFKSGALQCPIGAVVGLILAAELIIVLGGYAFAPQLAGTVAQPTPDIATRHNTAALGDILYTDYVHFFQIAGMVLLVAMIGAIVLTLRHKAGVKRQDISAQVARTPATAIEIKKVETGKGI